MASEPIKVPSRDVEATPSPVNTGYQPSAVGPVADTPPPTAEPVQAAQAPTERAARKSNVGVTKVTDKTKPVSLLGLNWG